jgi:hypothetical protein
MFFTPTGLAPWAKPQSEATRKGQKPGGERDLLGQNLGWSPRGVSGGTIVGQTSRFASPLGEDMGVALFSNWKTRHTDMEGPNLGREEHLTVDE